MESAVLVNFLKQSFGKAGFSRAVIALSGGVDSAVSCALTVRALGKENVYPVLMPYGILNKQGVVDARLVIDVLQIPNEHVTEIDIAPFVDSRLSLEPDMDNIRKGNIMARERMITLFDQAKKRRALVVGTENKSEELLGYFTRFGDSASDIEPLHNLYKTEVYELAKSLGIPEPILVKKPTAGLWEGQTDEGEFGFTYKEADEILATGKGDPKTVAKVKARVAANSFKHHLPIVPNEI